MVSINTRSAFAIFIHCVQLL